MIRFCDGYAFSIDIKTYTRQELLLDIVSNKLRNAVFEVYDEQEWLGYVQSWDLLDKSKDLSQCLHTDKILYDQNVFAKCNAFFDSNPAYNFLPVYNAGGEIFCIAYKDESDIVRQFEMKELLTALYEYPFVKLSQCYPNIKQIVLDGVNELSFLLYQYMHKWEEGFSYKLQGEMWSLLGTDEYEREMVKPSDVAKSETVTVLVENPNEEAKDVTDEAFYIRSDVTDNYLFLYLVRYFNYNAAVDATCDFLQKINIKSAVVNIPEWENLEYVSEEEVYCHANRINLNYIYLMDKSQVSYLCDIYGAEYCKNFLENKMMENRNISSLNGLGMFDILEEERENTIYLIGPCVVWQTDMMANDTILANVQRLADSYRPGKYKVKSVSTSFEQFNHIKKAIESLNLHEGDMVLFVYCHSTLTGHENYLDLKDLFDARNGERWFSDECVHVNQLGSRRIAEYMFEHFISKHFYTGERKPVWNGALTAEEQAAVNQYTEQYSDMKRNGKCGAIVMNCNPYTKGHDYLIREARKRVDWLYVFVVEEDKSFISFEDRFRIVSENTRKYENVIVVPSGKVILSMNTLPTYFMKETNQDLVVDAGADLKLFGLGIAPYFNISVRFVGEEPKDNITNQYNRSMEKMLPLYGIEFVEIPRKTDDEGNVISASRVRESLKKKDYDKLQEIVPKETYRYLVERFGL